MTGTTVSEVDFDHLSWHDNLIYGLRLEVGDPERQEWHSRLVLDIDHIVTWVCGRDGGARFEVAPATLTFHDATDLSLTLDFGDSGCRQALNELSIDALTRTPVAGERVSLDRPYYRWRIELNLPRGGLIRFGASGFTQELRAAPTLCDLQRLPAGERA